MTEPDANMIRAHPGWEIIGPTYYIPAIEVWGGATLYRLYNPTTGDHMDSHVAGEGGYSTDFPMGFPWWETVAPEGTTQVYRLYNPSTGDHALRSPNWWDPLGYYQVEPTHLFAYPIRENDPLLTIGNGLVTLASNPNAGCATWSLVWNNYEFVNVWDLGRQIVTDFLLGPNLPSSYRPTEPGDMYSCQGPGCSFVSYISKHRTPPTICQNSWASLSQRTEAVPFEWNPDLPGLGGGEDRPVLYPAVRLGKEVTLSYNGWRDVVSYESVIKVPGALDSGVVPVSDVPVIYVNAIFNNFYRFEGGAYPDWRRLDPSGDGFPMCAGASGIGYAFSPAFGALVASTPGGEAALGLYAAHTSVLGTASDLALTSFVGCVGTGGSPNSFNTVRIAARNFNGLVGGENRFRAWIVVGTLADVQARLRLMYSHQVK